MACKSHGIYLTFLLRCSAVLPYFFVSYFLSVTDSTLHPFLTCIVRLSHYVLGNFGFLLPTLVYIYLGASAKQLFSLFNQASSTSDGDTPRGPEQQKVHDFQVALLITGIVLMVGVVTLIGCVTKRELDKMIKEGEMEGL